VNTNVVGLEESQQCIEEFYDTHSDVVASVQRHEDRLASHRALGAAANDRRHFDKIRVSIDPVNLMQGCMASSFVVTVTVLMPGYVRPSAFFTLWSI